MKKKVIISSDHHLKNDYLDWYDIENLVKKTVLNIKKINKKKYDLIIGIKNGGIIPAILIARELDINYIEFITVKRNKILKFNKFHKDKKSSLLIIDDIYDTGKTFSIVNEYFKRVEYDYACLISRYKIPDNNNKIVTGKVLNHKKWIVFPWENG